MAQEKIILPNYFYGWGEILVYGRIYKIPFCSILRVLRTSQPLLDTSGLIFLQKGAKNEKRIIEENNKLKALKLTNNEIINIEGLFIYIVSTPNINFLEKLNLEVENNFIKVDKNMQTSITKIGNKITGKEKYCQYESILNKYSVIEDISNNETEYSNALNMYKQCDIEKAKIYEEKYNTYLKEKERKQKEEKQEEQRRLSCKEELACSIKDNFEGKKDYLSIQYINIYDETCSLPQKNINQRLSDLSKFCDEDTIVGFKKAYEQFTKRKKEIEAEEEQERLFEEEKQKLSKKYGKPFCDADPVRNKDCVGFLNKENLFGIPEWKVFQQASDGTLIESRMAGGILGYNEPVFIMKNSIDSQLIDDETLPTGVFTRVGSYSYTTVLGGNKTIIKLKRLE